MSDRQKLAGAAIALAVAAVAFLVGAYVQGTIIGAACLVWTAAVFLERLERRP